MTQRMRNGIGRMIEKNKTYITSQGDKVRIYTTDGTGIYPVHGARACDGSWQLCAWTRGGSFIQGIISDEDLIEFKTNVKVSSTVTEITITVPQHMLDKLPEGYEFDTVRPVKPEDLHYNANQGTWTRSVVSTQPDLLMYVARKARPWYPESWLDEAGNPLPDVYEVTPGEWPPCKPGDTVEVLRQREREKRNSGRLTQFPAYTYQWPRPGLDLENKVAIRVIRRAGEWPLS